MANSVLFLALLSLASGSAFEMNHYLDKMDVQRPRRPDFVDYEFEDGLMYLCCDTNDPNEENKAKERARKIKQECCEEMMSKLYGRVQRMPPPHRRHRQYLNETACFMLCGFRKLEAADNEGNVKDGMTETVAASLGITSNTVIEEAEKICYNRTQDMKDKFPNLTCNVAPYMFLKCMRELNNLHCPTERKLGGRMCERYHNNLNQTYRNQN